MDRQEQLEALEAKVRDECPACGKAAGSTSDAVYYSLQPLDEATEPVNHGKPLLSLVCMNCGFVRLHHTWHLGSD
jgi:predicted RNA-binding Zn-ribbon protein involved in translation (DUF1610 family)